MAEKTGDKTFQRMALAMMALTGVGTLLHAVHTLYRDFRPKRDTKPAASAPQAEPHGETTPHSRNPESSGFHTARISDRPAEGERVWADTVSRQVQTRHR